MLQVECDPLLSQEGSQQETIVTFQVVLIGNAGIVVASDRRVTIITPTAEGKEQPQFSITDKFRKSGDESVICFGAGGPRSLTMAQEIAIDPPAYDNEVRWVADLSDRARRVQEARRDFDEVIVVRRDFLDRVWLLTRNQTVPPCAMPVYDRTCTGNPLAARFLVEHFYEKELPLSELQAIAVLAISCAHEEHPSHVGGEIDVMTLTAKSGVCWRRISKSESDQQRKSFVHSIGSWLKGNSSTILGSE
jgi:hypothetical protein